MIMDTQRSLNENLWGNATTLKMVIKVKLPGEETFFKPLLKVEVKKKKSFSFDKCSKITT